MLVIVSPAERNELREDKERYSRAGERPRSCLCVPSQYVGRRYSGVQSTQLLLLGLKMLVRMQILSLSPALLFSVATGS